MMMMKPRVGIVCIPPRLPYAYHCYVPQRRRPRGRRRCRRWQAPPPKQAGARSFSFARLPHCYFRSSFQHCPIVPEIRRVTADQEEWAEWLASYHHCRSDGASTSVAIALGRSDKAPSWTAAAAANAFGAKRFETHSSESAARDSWVVVVVATLAAKVIDHHSSW